MPLQTTYRPTSFDEIIGNKQVISALKAALKNKDHNHAMLFTGSSGTGKTTLARIVSTELGVYDPQKGNNFGFREINAGDFRGIDTIRSIREESAKVPLGSKKRVFFMDESHRMTRDAQEMFLKILEEAEGYNYYIFATTNPEALITTFKRRVATYELLPLADNEIANYLIDICDQEGIDAPEEVIDTIVGDSMGSLGIALGVLDAIKGLSSKQMIKAAKSQAAKQNAVIDLCRVLADQKTKWKEIAEILRSLKEQDQDAEGIRRAVIGYCSNWLLKQDNPRAFIILDSFREPMYNTGFPGVVHACYAVLNS